jgi:3-hydroxybutyryl-CoA dehydrogenase
VELQARSMARDRSPVIVIVGAGLMGRQIAVEFALHQCRVHVLVRYPPRAQQAVTDTLDRTVALGLTLQNEASEASANLSFHELDAASVSSADLLLECLPEVWQTKVEVVSAVLDRVAPAVVGTNTSSFSITGLGAAIGQPRRTVGIHYWNPPLLMPLVEVTSGDATSIWAVRLARLLTRRAGKTPITVRRDVPGFVWNRLQMAVLREALWLVQTGVTSVDDIDMVTQVGLARRWRHTGLFASVSLGNARQWEAIAANLFPLLSDAEDAHGLEELVAGGHERWQGLADRRDSALAREAGSFADPEDPEKD